MTANESPTPIDWDRYSAELAADTVAADPDAAPVLVDSEPSTAEAIHTSETRSIIPVWCRSKASFISEVKRAITLRVHALAYHAVRLPLYSLRLLASAPRGFARVIGGITRWATDEEGRIPRADTIAKHDYEGYRKLVAVRDRHVRWRGLCLTAGGILTLGTAITLVSIGGPLMWGSLAALVAAAGWAGRPDDKPVTDTAVVKTELKPLTANVVKRALSVLGIAGINKAPDEIHFTAPITRDGPGWRADIDLPYGVTAGEIADRRDKLASGLSRPLGCVWPEGRSEIHPGRLVLWVGDQDMAAAKQPASPLKKATKVDLFKPFKIGCDPRGRWVELNLMYTNVLIGSIPGMGKTFTMRLPLLAAALDPRAEIWGYELKGTGDLEPISHTAARYASGADDEELEQALQALRDLRKECSRRAKVIKGLPRDMCPENKVTPELASKKSLGLHPLVVGIDECQELFTHPDFGAEAAELAEKCIKLGRALGIILILATQRPDSKSVPTGVSANVGTRICLRVMGQMENDMILGTSAYKNGVRATMFTSRDKGVSYLVGQSDEADIVRWSYIDGPTSEAIAQRARATRAAEGTLKGYAAGDESTSQATPAWDILADILACWPASEGDKAWNSTIAARLADYRPDAWAALADLADEERTQAVTAELKKVGASSVVTSVGRRIDGKAITRRGIDRTKLQQIITLRDQKPGTN